MSTVSKIPSITIGGHTITDIENLVVLQGSGGATAVGIFLALYKDGEPSPYQVPVTHNLRVFGVRFKDTNQSRWGYGTVGYADGAANNTTVAPAGPHRVLSGANKSTATDFTSPRGDIGASDSEETAENFLIPGGKWPYAWVFDYASYRVYGVLELI